MGFNGFIYFLKWLVTLKISGGDGWAATVSDIEMTYFVTDRPNQ